MMRETGILYTPENIRAVARKDKWQTRRVIVPQPPCSLSQIEGTDLWTYTGCEYEWKPRYRVGDILYVKEGYARYENRTLYKIDADKMIVDAGRNWKPCHESISWKSPLFMPKWAARPELKRRVADANGTPAIRVQRVQDISEADAIAEGIEVVYGDRKKGHNFTGPGFWDTVSRHHGGKTYHVNTADGICCCVEGERFKLKAAICAFRILWDSINAKPKPVRQKGIITRYVSYPWDDIHETRKHRGKPWSVCGNPWVWAYSFEEL